MALSDGLPPKLTTSSGTLVDTATALEGADYVLLYFSAHWCPPCRAFTPVLSDWVQKKSKELKFKTVFVSSDRDERAFREYLKTMSWDLALPFGDPAKDELSSRFRIRGIPTLVIVDAAGNFITDDARGMVQADPAGEGFPWKKEGGPGGDGGGGGCVCM